jgi:acetyl-CoA synthetase
MTFGLDVRPDDVHWNVADPGWAYGLYYGLIGTLLIGQAPLYYNAPFSPEAAYEVMRRYGVTNLAAAPTAYRALRASGIETGDLPLRALGSAGEPLNPDVIAWAVEHLGGPIHDQYGQTEHGMFVINCRRDDLREPLKPGSMGHSMPGFRAVVIDPDGRELGAGEQGEVAIDTSASPLYWFRGYWQAPDASRERLVANGRYCLTGDAAALDGDGYFFFSSRADDVISSAGYRIGPFEVESSLMGHPAVGEAAVIGVPDQLRGEVVKAFVVLRPGHEPSDELAAELREFVRQRLSKHAYPREVAFVSELPKTPSGKVQRYLLRETAPVVAT